MKQISFYCGFNDVWQDKNDLNLLPCQKEKAMLNRKQDWIEFSEQVLIHIDQYTIPQYQSEDAHQDQVGAWTAEDCKKAIERYINRFGKNLRGSKEALRDMLKVAHYAQFTYNKLKEELNEPDVYEAG